MNEIIHRIIAQFILIGVPIAALAPFLESIKNEALLGVIAIIFIAWYIYLNMWSKQAARLYNTETLYLLEAWSKARVIVNADIIIKLAYLPMVGGYFEKWINRNNPDYGDDREIKINTEEK